MFTNPLSQALRRLLRESAKFVVGKRVGCNFITGKRPKGRLKSLCTGVNAKAIPQNKLGTQTFKVVEPKAREDEASKLRP